MSLAYRGWKGGSYLIKGDNGNLKEKVLFKIEELAYPYNTFSDDDLTTITFSHPIEKMYDLILTVSNDEIILVFDNFHLHYEDHANIRNIDDVITDMFRDVDLLLSSPKIDIVEKYKGSKLLSTSLRVIDENGIEHKLDEWHFSFGILKIFDSSQEIRRVTSFRSTL